MRTLSFKTPVGFITISGEDALEELTFQNLGSSGAPSPLLLEAQRQIEAYFRGQLRTFDLPLRFTRGTVFQQQVWSALAHIPYGETITYGQLADRLNRPKSSRAVGQACGRNPIGLILPCHRVIGASGALTGFAGGLSVKAALLDFEKHHI